jgi:hypothetical protein
VVAPEDPLVGDKGAGQELRLPANPRDFPDQLIESTAEWERSLRDAETTVQVLTEALGGRAEAHFAKAVAALPEAEGRAEFIGDMMREIRSIRDKPVFRWSWCDIKARRGLLLLPMHSLDRSYIPRLEQILPPPFVPWEVLQLALDYPELESALLPRPHARPPSGVTPTIRLAASLPALAPRLEPPDVDLDPRLGWLIACQRHGISGVPHEKWTGG